MEKYAMQQLISLIIDFFGCDWRFFSLLSDHQIVGFFYWVESIKRWHLRYSRGVFVVAVVVVVVVAGVQRRISFSLVWFIETAAALMAEWTHRWIRSILSRCARAETFTSILSIPSIFENPWESFYGELNARSVESQPVRLCGFFSVFSVLNWMKLHRYFFVKFWNGK